MVSRGFAAFDNEAFTIASSSPNGVTGTPIINNSSTPVGSIYEFRAGFPYQTITLDDTSSTPDIFDDDDEENHVINDGGSLVGSGPRLNLKASTIFACSTTMATRPVRASRSQCSRTTG